jgi:hypothetical protein
MRGVYEASANISAVSAAKTLLYITAPSGKTVEVLEATVTNPQNETNEQCEFVLQKITTLGTPTATTLTPSKCEQGDQAAGSTVKGNVTASEPTYTANTEVGREGVPSLSGWRYEPQPENRLIIAGGDSWGLRVLNSPAAVDLIPSLKFREVG